MIEAQHGFTNHMTELDAGVRWWHRVSRCFSRIARWADHRATERYFRNVTGSKLDKATRKPTRLPVGFTEADGSDDG